MYKKDLDDCLENGAITKEEYDGIMEHLKEDECGQLTGGMAVDEKYWKFNLNGDFFSVPLWQNVYERVAPPLGVEHHFPVFAKYGYTMCGICDGFKWDREALRNADEKDLWQMMAIAERFWRVFYERINDRLQPLLSHHWVVTKDGSAKCSECGQVCNFSISNGQWQKYCGNCGSPMFGYSKEEE